MKEGEESEELAKLIPQHSRGVFKVTSQIRRVSSGLLPEAK